MRQVWRCVPWSNLGEPTVGASIRFSNQRPRALSHTQKGPPPPLSATRTGGFHTSGPAAPSDGRPFARYFVLCRRRFVESPCRWLGSTSEPPPSYRLLPSFRGRYHCMPPSAARRGSTKRPRTSSRLARPRPPPGGAWPPPCEGRAAGYYEFSRYARSGV